MKRIAFLGMPNTGKSTLFNRLSGSSARVGNWPGITVDLHAVKTFLGGHMAELVDLPGIYDLQGLSEDEKIVQSFINNNKIDLAIVVLCSTQIERQLSLLLQLQKLHIPCVLALNMYDEAKKMGIAIDAVLLEKKLKTPVIKTSAKYGEGMVELLKACTQVINQKVSTPIKKIKPLNASDLISNEKMIQTLIKLTVKYPAKLNDKNTKKLDGLFLDPYWGLPIFFFIVFSIFQFIFTLGKPIQDLMTQFFNFFRLDYLEPLFINHHGIFESLLLDGLYLGVTTVAAFVPIIILFFLIMSVVEDSGYFSRAAFLMDTLMEKIGLDGRGFVMMLMGFGCNVPALMGTKIMRTKELRLLTMFVIPFSLCSARLQVFLFIITALFSVTYGPLVLFCLYLLSFFTIFISALIFKHQFKNKEPIIIELPPYRFPTLNQIVKRSMIEIKHFLTRATKFIIIGVLLVWALTHFPMDVPIASELTYSGQLGKWLSPIFDPIGINEQLVIALIFGFIAKEIVIGALAVIYGVEGSALAHHLYSNVSQIQAISFMIFTLIYTPCLSTIATLKNESKNLSFVIYSVFWALLLAWVFSFIFYQTSLYFSS
ncbi:ferrous iron transport protein B [Candidatus Methylopumilus planktonicus]|uniref:ferrous iron transport protein B n=1 Tax=Candidatus Methylopumilus planktonicus TaxID=1581557 RepID=UPI003D18BA92